MSIEEYKIKVMEENEVEAVLDHLRKYFFIDEPLNKSINLIDSEDSNCPGLENYCKKCMVNGISYIAVTNAGEVVSVCLSNIENLEEEEETPCSSEYKFDKITTFLTYSDNQATRVILKRYPHCKTMMDVKILSTHSLWAGRGLAKKLVALSSKTANEKGCDLIRMNCSSYFSAKVVEKLGFECVYELKYSDYKVNGEQVFKTEHPHTSKTTYIQLLNGSS
ncbi:hypothetical protein FQA39_LY00599 [Lamprigera yunnana]|nr:hypothetical protein FQA39_LY00599 [Lamprigera yunnana]